VEVGGRLGLVSGEERGQDSVVDLGVEDGEPESVGGQIVGVGVGTPDDQAVSP
jgi:hypothetical protein